MSAAETVLTLSIGAVLQGSVAAAFGGAQKAVTTLGSEINKLTQKQNQLGDSIQKHMRNLSAQTIAPMVREYEKLGAAIDKAKTNQIKLGQAIQAQKHAAAQRQELRGELRETVGTAAAMLAPIGLSVKAYMEQEKAMTDMKIAYLKAGGEVGEAFAEVKRQAVELGNQFPGTTADFLRLGQVLKEQGVKDSAVTGGGLRAAASFNVLMGTSQEAGGEIVAKLMEARGIADKDLVTAVDQMQRAKFAFGMKPEDLKFAMQYDAPTANMLGLKGLGNQEKLLALQGMGAQVGLEGSSWGTNFSMMLTRLAKGPEAIESATKGSKGHSKDVISQAGVSFDFFDKAGNFGGVENMITQLEKLKTIKDKFGEKEALTVANDMFGMEAGRVAMILADKGKKGLDENLQKMREQASLQERMAEKSKTLSNAYESFTGTIVNGMASVGEIFSGDLQSFFMASNSFISDTLVPWVQNNKELIGGVVKLSGGLMLGRIGLLGMRYGVNLMLGPVRSLSTAFHTLKAGMSILNLIRLGELSKSAGVLRMFGVGAENAAKWGSRLGNVGGAIKKVPSALNPVGMIGRIAPVLSGALAPVIALGAPVLLIIGAVAAAAFLIWKYWKPIKAFFGGLWEGLKQGMAPLMPLFSKIGAAAAVMFAPLKPVWNWVVSAASTICGWFGNIFQQEENVGNGARNMGVKVGAAIGKFITAAVKMQVTIVSAFGAVFSFFAGLPAKFMQFGINMIEGLVNGIKSKIGQAVDAIKGLASQIGGAFNSHPEIDSHSPSRAFFKNGGWITIGAALGIENGYNRVKKAVVGLAKTTSSVGLESPLINAAARVPQANNIRSSASSNTASVSAGSVHINFNPTIQITSNGKTDPQSQVQQAMQWSLRELEGMIQRIMDEKTRRAF